MQYPRGQEIQAFFLLKLMFPIKAWLIGLITAMTVLAELAALPFQEGISLETISW